MTKIKIYNSKGSTYNPILEYKNKWIPREGDTIILNGRYWYISGVLHDFDKDEVIIYVQNNKGEISKWVDDMDKVKVIP